MNKPKCVLTVDVEAMDLRSPSRHVDTLIYGRINGEEWGIGRMMDIADKHGIKLTFFLDFAEVELYGDEIIEVGKYIDSRGHDLQVHCHCNFLAERVMNRFPNADKNYYTWYENEEISDFIVDYCLEQYRKCTAKPPLVFRGGAYRFGAALLKKLREKGFMADSSYNCLRPKQRPVNKQFVFENGIIELPLGILPERAPLHAKLLNFNYDLLYPIGKGDWKRILEDYKSLFHDFYWYYGDDAIATLIMHSWSFCYKEERFRTEGYIDSPNPNAAILFDLLLETLSEQIDFIPAAKIVQTDQDLFLKTVNFDSVFSFLGRENTENLRQIESFIRQKAGGRDVVVWGRGWLESAANQKLDFSILLNVAFYISKDAVYVHRWRGKPVKTFEEAHLSPEQHYVFVMAQSIFPEIRDELRKAGFSEYDDYCDIERPVPVTANELVEAKRGVTCPICGGDEFEAFNSDRPRRCVKCGSVERNRTIVKLFSENLGMEPLSGKILHVSPSKSERLFFKQAGAQNITTIDVRPQVKPDIVADICNMPDVASDSFDMVFANCVLNHVYDDEAALSEIHRVLREKGLFVVWVMGSGGMKTTVDEDPTTWYGQETMDTYRVGTYRHYGETDFTAQLKRHFAKVRCYEKYDAPSEISCCWYVCEK